MTGAFELNLDGIIGPTHNYSGLSYGNVASMTNATAASHPKRAALQGLAKMKVLHEMGLKQAVLPPHERPHIPTLRRLGYSGSDAEVLAKAVTNDLALLASVSSASSMWAANAATVSPSADTSDGRVHITPANLVSNLHRSIEPDTTARVLKVIFADEERFTHHPPLPATTFFADEGAANHTRLCTDYASAGVELFTFGQKANKFPARQSEHASRRIARMHGVNDPVFCAQSSAAIDAGAFHNDVVAVGNRDLLLYHERAWDNAPAVVAAIKQRLPHLRAVRVSEADLPLRGAISSYLFNSQIVTTPEGRDVIIAPVEARSDERAAAVLDRIGLRVHIADVRESMRNGGGPACLRLRVVLTEAEFEAAHQGVMFTSTLHEQLKTWIERNYRDRLVVHDLGDPKLLDESRRALDELTQILRLGSIYAFQ